MSETRPTRTPKGVDPEHRAFFCDNLCDEGRIERGRSPEDEGWERCPECDGVGRLSLTGCSECNDLVAPSEVRSVDNAYVYCEQCTEKLCAATAEQTMQSVLDRLTDILR